MSPINIPEGEFITFSNPLFDSNDDFTSSDDELLSDEDVPDDNVKIYLNPLFEFDDEYISSDINPLFDEVLEDIESKDSYVSKLDEPDFLVTPLSDANEDEYFDPRREIDEIDAFLEIDISTDIKNSYHDSEGDIIYLEILLIDDTISNLPPKVFLDHDPKNLKDEPDNKDLKSMVKVFDLGIHETNSSPTYIRIYQKSHENRQERANTDTRNGRAQKKPEMQSQNDRIQDDRERLVKSSFSLTHSQDKATWLWKKAQGELGFTLGSLREVTQGSHQGLPAWQSV
ncbi:hypothetical protein Tco_1363237 [Tanacetum coccineum]